jgi:iron complex outermembrane receptor protein
MSTTLLGQAIRRALRMHGIAGVTLAFASVAAPALAQDKAADAPSQQLETVTVTGSRIRKADVETAQPIVVIDRTAIEHQGFNSVADILQNLSEAGSPPISRASALASGESVGGYYVSLRNLGANRTLVLLNGKRLGATTSGTQDLSQVPVSAIERVEVLKDGASAIYGSDAIAGVINIITRKNYDGAEASAYVGQFDEDDGAKQTYSMTFGSHNDRGSITFSAEYSKEDPVWAKDRPYSAYPNSSRHPTSGWSLATQWGAFYFPEGFCAGQDDSPLGTCTLKPGGNPFDPADYHGTNAAGGNSDRSNANEQMMLQTGIERRSLFVNGEYAITDNIRFSTDILYNKRSTTQQIAGYPFQPAFSLPGSTSLIGLSAQSYYNPVGDRFLGEGNGHDVYFYRRGWEVPRTRSNDLSTYRVSGTLEGSFSLGERTFNWDVGGYVNTNDLLKLQRGDFSLIALAGALGPSFLDPATGRVTCGTPDNPIPYGSSPGSCIPWNPILPAGQGGSGSLSDPALQAYLFPEYHDTGRTRTVDYSANITGPVFTLPAGDVNVAAGYEYRNETGDFVPDAFSQAGISTNLSAGPTSGKYTVEEYYVEVDVPVLKDLPFARELSFNVAARHSDYSSFGKTTNGKFSLTWRPLDDLLVRGNYAQGFRAPTINDLFGGLGGTFDSYTDPCDVTNGEAGINPAVLARCTSGFGGQHGTPANFHQLGQGGSPCTAFPCQTGIQFLSGSNPTLQPETTTTKTLGMVYSPSWIGGLDISLDWYRVRINNAITADSVQQIVDDCYLRGVTSRCSNLLFTRDPVTGVVNYALRGQTNQGWVDTEGYDLGVNYRLPEFSFGRFAIHWDTTYVAHLNTKPDNDPATIVQPSTSLGSNFRTRSNASLDWTLGDFGATWTTRYFSSIKEKCSSFPGECNMPDHVAPDTGPYKLNRTGGNTFHDLQVRWNAPWNASIAAGVNNVFNHVGPVLYSAPNSSFTYYGGFDIGRFYYLRYTQKF